MLMTPACTRIVHFARTAYPCLGHSFLSSAHLLLGFLKLNSDQWADLKKARLTFESVKEYLRSHPLRPEQTRRVNDLTLGESAKLAINRAKKTAKKNREQVVWTLHLWQALLEEEEGPASEVLDAHEVDRVKFREHLSEQLSAAELARREKRRKRRLDRDKELRPEFWADP
jgi:ATP-dependent Clp protease ATP-binding subunit ClpA